MSNQTNLATVDTTNLFVLPDVQAPGDFSREDLAEDMDGLRLSFPRVKIPAGGVLQFEMPGDDPEHPEYVDKLSRRAALPPRQQRLLARPHERGG